MEYTPKLMYKGKPLVRCGNEIYYGSMQDPYVLYLQVMTSKVENGQEEADKIHLILLSTDTGKPLPERIMRQTTKQGLFNALDIGGIWLEKALADAVQA